MYRRMFNPYAAAAPRGYLGSMGANPIQIQLPDGTVNTYNDIEPAIATDLNNGGRPIRPGGGFYNVTTFEGGYLFDNCPLNVILTGIWDSGQQAALYAAGLTPSCPQVGPVAIGGSTAMIPAAPTTTSPATPASTAQSFTRPTPGYTNTLTTGGMVTTPSSPAPQSGIISSQMPASPTSPVVITTGSGPSDMNPAGLPGPGPTDFLPYVVVGILAIMLLKGKGA